MLDTYHGNEHTKIKLKLKELNEKVESLEYIGADYYWDFKEGHDKAYEEWEKYYNMELEAYCEMYAVDAFRWDNDREEFYRSSKPRKRFDENGDVIDYDYCGNRASQFINLKTGERI